MFHQWLRRALGNKGPWWLSRAFGEQRAEPPNLGAKHRWDSLKDVDDEDVTDVLLISGVLQLKYRIVHGGKTGESCWHIIRLYMRIFMYGLSSEAFCEQLGEPFLGDVYMHVVIVSCWSRRSHEEPLTARRR